MSKPATNRGKASSAPRLRWSWDLGFDLGEADTRRLLQLLTALLETPALGRAAAAAGMSYRAAWGLLRRCAEEFGLALVVMERGRGTRLTALGESLVEMDGAARLALDKVHAVWETRMHGLLAPMMRQGGAGGVSPRLTLHASHDLALADWVEHGRRVPVDVTWQGSEEALAGLGRGECDVAGFHVPETWAADRLAAWLKRWLKPRLHVLVPLMRRRQGLIVARGNPLRLRSLADVATRGARMVNRQRGSGTRTLIDQLLAANGVSPGSIDGYAHEEFTHDAVAATVAGGSADAGFGIMAAAARYDLDFVPLVTERYGLALRHAAMNAEAGQALLRRVSGPTFRERLAALPGYEPLPVVVADTWAAFLHA